MTKPRAGVWAHIRVTSPLNRGRWRRLHGHCQGAQGGRATRADSQAKLGAVVAFATTVTKRGGSAPLDTPTKSRAPLPPGPASSAVLGIQLAGAAAASAALASPYAAPA